jgi:integrase
MNKRVPLNRAENVPLQPVRIRCVPGVTGARLARACMAAGIAHYHPHDLRHRCASVKIAEGVPVTQLAAQLGHSKKSLTLDVYSQVLIDHA